jgi:hypothetical protein
MWKIIKNKRLLLIIFVIVLLIIALIIFLTSKKDILNFSDYFSPTFKGQIIEDTIVLPDTVAVAANEGEFIPRGAYNVKLRPQSERDQVLIPQALLTLKQSYDLAAPVIEQWSSDSKLIFIRSLGALGLDGKSSAWQIVYGSEEKQKGLEIIIQADKIVSQKEIDSKVSGFDLPSNWYDSYEAIASLQNLVQFYNDTISSISFYYSSAGDSWAYGLATGQAEKTTSMWVK